MATPNADPIAMPMLMLTLIAVPERQLFVECGVFIILCEYSMLPNSVISQQIVHGIVHD